MLGDDVREGDRQRGHLTFERRAGGTGTGQVSRPPQHLQLQGGFRRGGRCQGAERALERMRGLPEPAGVAARDAAADVDIGECILRDVSTTGARISVEVPEIVPDYFKLKIPGAREIWKCRVRWRSGNDVGLEFFGAK